LWNDHSASEILKGDFFAAFAAHAGETNNAPEAASVVLRKFLRDVFFIAFKF